MKLDYRFGGARYFSAGSSAATSSFHSPLSIDRPRGTDDKGSALVEFAILVPLFVLLVFNMIDISLLVINYSKLEQAVREGVRTAARTPVFLPGSNGVAQTDIDTLTNITACNAPVPPIGIDCSHVVVQARIRRVMEIQQMHMGTSGKGVHYVNPIDYPSLNGPSITTKWVPPDSVVDVANRDTYSVEVSARFYGFWKGVTGEYPMQIRYQGPWLYGGMPAP